MNVEKTVADFFGLTLLDINDDSSPRTIGLWDSMKHIELVLVLEQKAGVRFKASEIPMLTSIGGIKKVLDSK
jgi:acyl carrier protein